DLRSHAIVERGGRGGAAPSDPIQELEILRRDAGLRSRRDFRCLFDQAQFGAGPQHPTLIVPTGARNQAKIVLAPRCGERTLQLRTGASTPAPPSRASRKSWPPS